LAHPEAELAVARAAASAGTIAVFSTGSYYSIRQIAAAAGPKWFQLYPMVDREVTARLVANAEEAGCEAVALTVTAFYSARRERHMRRPLPETPDFEMGNLNEAGAPGLRESLHNPHVPLTWADMAWVRSLTKLPLVLKGVQTGEDALLAVEHGVDGIIVSNHGGRQLDGTLATIEALPEVVDAVGGRVEVLVDGGIRRGTDVLKALALGARAVLVARPVLWGLALEGEAGVRRVLAMLRDEIDNAMAQAGLADVQSIDRSWVAGPGLPTAWAGHVQANDAR
jgi:4-hydroxymandelate oxidase